MNRAFDLGPVEAAAIRTAGGKIRLRLLFTEDQLETMLIAARAHDPPGDATPRNAMQRDATADSDETRIEDDEDDAGASVGVRDSVQPVPPTAPVGRSGPQFVARGTRAWDAWLKAGHNDSLCVRREHEGRVRTGWHFPSLFPPKSPEHTGAKVEC